MMNAMGYFFQKKTCVSWQQTHCVYSWQTREEMASPPHCARGKKCSWWHAFSQRAGKWSAACWCYEGELCSSIVMASAGVPVQMQSFWVLHPSSDCVAQSWHHEHRCINLHVYRQPTMTLGNHQSVNKGAQLHPQTRWPVKWDDKCKWNIKPDHVWTAEDQGTCCLNWHYRKENISAHLIISVLGVV